MSKYDFKRGKVPLKHIGKRTVILNRIEIMAVPSQRHQGVDAMYARSIARVYWTLGRKFQSTHRLAVLEGYTREAFECISNLYLYSTDRALIGRPFGRAIREARECLEQTWGVDLSQSSDTPQAYGFRDAVSHWERATWMLVNGHAPRVRFRLIASDEF